MPQACLRQRTAAEGVQSYGHHRPQNRRRPQHHGQKPPIPPPHDPHHIPPAAAAIGTTRRSSKASQFYLYDWAQHHCQLLKKRSLPLTSFPFLRSVSFFFFSPTTFDEHCCFKSSSWPSNSSSQNISHSHTNSNHPTASQYEHHAGVQPAQDGLCPGQAEHGHVADDSRRKRVAHPGSVWV